MSALVCDVCGGKLVVVSGAIAVCENCGLEHSQDRMKEKLQEIKGTVQPGNYNMVDRWMEMGDSAYNAGNEKEAYDYYTKVVEFDPQNWLAIFKKGKAAAHQSTPENIRIDELRCGINMALKIVNTLNLPKDEIAKIKNDFAHQMDFINWHITEMVKEDFDNLYYSDKLYHDLHWDLWWDVHWRFKDEVSELEYALSLIVDLEDDCSKKYAVRIRERICHNLQYMCESIQCWEDYSQTNYDYFGRYSKEKKEYIDKYWDLIDEIRTVDPAYVIKESHYPDPFDPGSHSADEICNYWKEFEAERNAQREKREAEKRLEKYWEEHADEKNKLEGRISSIEDEIKQLKTELSSYESRIAEAEKEKKNPVPAETELNALNDKVADLLEKKKALNIFQVKQKRALKEQINKLSDDMNSIQSKVKLQRDELQKNVDSKIGGIKAEMKPCTDKIAELESERNNIIDELKKPR